MRKHLFVTLLLTCGMPFGYGFTAFAEPAPQTQNQAVATITGTILDENNEPVVNAGRAAASSSGASESPLQALQTVKILKNVFSFQKIVLILAH